MIKDFSWALASKLFANVLSLLLIPIFVDISPESYKLFSYFISYTGLVAFIDSGFSYKLLNLCISNDDNISVAIFKAIEKLFFRFAIPILIVVGICVYFKDSDIGQIIIIIPFLLLEIMSRLYLRLFRSFSNAQERLHKFSQREMTFVILRFLLLLWLINYKNVFLLIMASSIAHTLNVLLERYLLSYKSGSSEEYYTGSYHFFYHHGLVSLFASLTVYLDKILLVNEMTTSEYNNLQIAFKFSLVVLLLSNPMSQVLQRFFNKRGFGLSIITLITILIWILASLVSWLTCPYILRLWLGELVTPEIVTLSQILILASLAMLVGQIPFAFIVAKELSRFQLVISILNIILVCSNLFVFFSTHDIVLYATIYVAIASAITLIYMYKMLSYARIHSNTY